MTVNKKISDQSPVITDADTLWNEIKDRPINMFALPEQKVHQYCVPVPIEPSKLYVLARTSAVLPSLESALGSKYAVELVDKYIVISRTITSPTKL